MKKKLLLLSFLALPFLILGCKPTPQEKYQESLLNYQKLKTPETKNQLLIDCFNYLGGIDLAQKNLVLKKDGIFSIKEKKISLIYPDKLDFPKEIVNYNLSSHSQESGLTAFSDGERIKIYDTTPKMIKDFSPQKANNEKITSLILVRDQLYYFIEKNVWHYSINSDDNQKISKTGDIKTPYKKYSFLISPQLNGSSIVFSIGVGGEYYLYALDTNTDKLYLTQLRAATSDFAFNGNTIYFLSYKNNYWILESINLSNKNRKKIKKLKKLKDIHFLKTATSIYQQNQEFILNYDQLERINLPQGIKIKGSYLDQLLITYQHSAYLINEKKFFQEISVLEEKIPEIFK